MRIKLKMGTPVFFLLEGSIGYVSFLYFINPHHSPPYAYRKFSLIKWINSFKKKTKKHTKKKTNNLKAKTKYKYIYTWTFQPVYLLS